jgi:putative ABC transport system ATP-binding protein
MVRSRARIRPRIEEIHCGAAALRIFVDAESRRLIAPTPSRRRCVSPARRRVGAVVASFQSITMIKPALVTIDDLRKSYEPSGVVALDGVTLTIADGELVSLVGASGSGKSTLLNILGGIDMASSGRVVIDGQSVTGASDRQMVMLRRTLIGIVFQFFNLMPTLTVLENVTLPAELAGRRESEARERALQLLEQVGMTHRAAHRPHELSGGEMQRTAIARALINRPRLLLADEPTGNLDSKNGAIILEMLRRLARDEGSTLVVATHDHAVAAIADRIVEMRDGRVLREEVGTGRAGALAESS